MADRGDSSSPSDVSLADSSARELTGVLHDVSNALTVLLGWVGEARREGARPDEIAEALEVVEQRARLARDLARRALGAARVDAARDSDPSSCASALDVVRDVVRALAIEAGKKGVRLVVEASQVRAGLVRGAPELGHVVTNLLLNAVAFAPDGSVVTVSVTDAASDVSIAVEDEGTGVPADQRTMVFSGDARRPGGAGVGLGHARRVARGFGGDVTLADEAASARGGARFVVRWPARSEEGPPPSIPAPSLRSRQMAMALRGKRVLVLDDDPAVVDLVEAALDARGADVETCSTHAELGETFGGGAFDAALLDLSPIAADVEGALATLRARSPGARIVLVTGSADTLPDLARFGDVTVVRKPFEMRELVGVLVAPAPAPPPGSRP